MKRYTLKFSNPAGEHMAEDPSGEYVRLEEVRGALKDILVEEPPDYLEKAIRTLLPEGTDEIAVMDAVSAASIGWTAALREVGRRLSDTPLAPPQSGEYNVQRRGRTGWWGAYLDEHGSWWHNGNAISDVLPETARVDLPKEEG